MISEFAIEMRKLLGDSFPAFEKSQAGHQCSGIRANTLKISPEELAEILVVETGVLEHVPWCGDGFYLPETETAFRPGKSPLYHAGLYYIQEASAMSAVEALGVEDVLPKQFPKVLDLCAAPGGKATQLAAKLEGQGLLVCNDASPSRAKALVKNLELAGVRNAVVVCEQPYKLAKVFAGKFDRILIDAPCSGEGMFRKDKSVAKAWHPSRRAEFAGIQRDILCSARAMLAKGGRLVYSTCTFNTIENEEVIESFLAEFPELSLMDISLCASEGFRRGLSEATQKCLRLWPHLIRGEGHFLASLEYEAGFSTHEDGAAEMQIGRTLSREEAALFTAFSEDVLGEAAGWMLDFRRLVVLGNVLHLLPEVHIPLEGIRTLKAGIRMGEFKKGRFEPGQAMACCLGVKDVRRALELPPASGEVLRYLKGETIRKTGLEGGFALVTTAGFGVGWCKIQSDVVKNKYNRHWLMS